MNLTLLQQAKKALLKSFYWQAEHANIWPVFSDPAAFQAVVEGLAHPFEGRVTKVAAVESRGFLLGGAVALRLNVGFIPVRKQDGLFPGEKLVRRTASDYRGNQHILRIQRAALSSDDQVLLVDDWLETGSQVRAAAALVAEAGAKVAGCAVLVDQLSDIGAPPVAPEIIPHAIVRYSELPLPPCCAAEHIRLT